MKSIRENVKQVAAAHSKVYVSERMSDVKVVSNSLVVVLLLLLLLLLLDATASTAVAAACGFTEHPSDVLAATIEFFSQ